MMFLALHLLWLFGVAGCPAFTSSSSANNNSNRNIQTAPSKNENSIRARTKNIAADRATEVPVSRADVYRGVGVKMTHIGQKVTTFDTN
jgi:hypothetical protein